MRLFFAPWIAALLFSSSLLAQQPRQTFAFYVSPSGSDVSPGTNSRPFATLARARKAVRDAGPPAQRGAVTVWVHGGLYILNESFVLSEQDSGNPEAPVIYRAVAGETPRIFGGTRLDGRAFKPTSDPKLLADMVAAARGHVMQLNVSGMKLSLQPYPDLFRGNGSLFRLFMDDRTMPLSRWPNAGYTTMESVIESGIEPRIGGTFVYREEVAAHARRWQNAVEEKRLWLTGFWRVPFEVNSLRVGHMDMDRRTMTLAAPAPGGIGSKYVETINRTRHGNGKEQYYAVNLVEEINRPGEWSFDFGKQTLFFWPPTQESLATHELLLASLQSAVVSLMGAKYVSLVGLTIEGGVHEGVLIQNGEHNTVAGSVIRNTGGGGIDVEGGLGNRIQSNDLIHLGSYGIRMVAGDRRLLIAGDTVADNNHISHLGEQERITEGIFMGGVSNKATHNLIHDATYNGIRYEGNDQYMAFNELHHIGLDAGDMGVFYTNGDWAAQGNRVEFNFGHHSPNANGSYLDDGASGRSTIGNVFYKLNSGIFLGGGHTNRVEGNLIVDCRVGIHIDNRGVARAYDVNAAHLSRMLQTIVPDAAPWSTRYPGFLKGIVGDPTQPTNNSVLDNVLVGDTIPYQLSAPAVVDHATNPTIEGDPGFVDLHGLDLRLKPASQIYKQLTGFGTVPMDKIGLYRDTFRATLPGDEATGRNVDRDGTQTFDSNVDVKASDRIGKAKP